MTERTHRFNAYGSWPFLFGAWIITLASTLGALFVGEVVGLEPCNLCWFQRIFMFPLAVILAIACYRTDTSVWRYAAPLALLGAAIAGFHTLVFLGAVPEAIQPCGKEVSCTSAEMTIFGVVPLPVLSFTAFVMIAVFLFVARHRRSA